MARGLIAYSTYLPHYVLSRRAIAESLGRGGSPSGVRSVASYDEDAITMAVAAVSRLPRARHEQNRLYLATSSPPFLDKSNASVVHAATGRDSWVLALDLAGLRSGFGALSTAWETGGIAVLSDLRTGRPGSAEESEGGDGAAAFLFGDSDDLVAEVLGTSSVSVELMDTWRTPGSEYPQVWEERFATYVHNAAIKDVTSQVAKDTGFTDTPTITIVATPNRRFATTAATSIGSLSGAGLQATHRESVGYCGAADAGLLLAAALDEAKTGDTILLVTAAGTVDAMLVRVRRDGPGSATREVDLAARADLGYTSYLTWRGFLEREPARRPERPGVAAPPAFRNQSWKYGLVGSRCTSCGKVYLPPERVCGSCGALDSTEPYSVAGLPGTIAAVTTDGVSDSPAPPAMAVMVDFEEGGRLMAELTDATPDSIRLGDRVDMTFRRTYTTDGVPNYFWKARPAKGMAR